MNLRPKTKKRLTILLTAGTAVVGVSATLYVLGLRHFERGRLQLRTAGLTAFTQGDYRTASVDLSHYLSNDRVDPEAIYDLAVCKTKLPRPDLGHLLEARKLFTRYLELVPGDLDAQHQLLEICQQSASPAETMTIAQSLLNKNPDDVPALLASLHQLDRDMKYAEALPLSLRLNELTPLDIRTQVTTLGLMSKLRKPPAEITDRADRLLANHPQDPRFQFLRGVADYFTNNVDGTRHWLQTAAAGTPPDADFIILLAGVFDKMGMWDQSQALLQKSAAAPGAAPAVRSTLAQRLFELGEYDTALNLLKDVTPKDPGADSHLLGLKGLILANRDHPSSAHPSNEFDAILSTLKTRDGDLPATAWAALLTVQINPTPPQPLEDVRLCQTAGRLDPDNADARFYLGLEYLRLGERELALQFFRQSIQLQPEWSQPYALIAELLTQRGQATEAAGDAQAACDRDPHSVSAQVARALACYAALRPSATTATLAPLLNYIQQVRAAAPNDIRLLCAQVDLLVRSNQRADAVSVATAALESPAANSTIALLQLETTESADHLNLSDVIDARASLCPINTPDNSLAAVQLFHATGKHDQARQLLPGMQTHHDLNWEIATLQARETVADPGIESAWESYSDAHPHDLIVQQAAAQSAIVNSNRALMDRVIDRLKSLTGDDALEWKLARVRWQLSGTDDAAHTNANAAAALLAEVVREAPQYPLPQILWADALVRLGESSGAIAHLRKAAEIDPGNPSVSLKLAAVLMEQGQSQEAISLLNGMVSNSNISQPQRVEAARLYRQAGIPAPAIALLRDESAIHPDDPSRDLLLAQMLVERGQRDAAANIFTALMQQPSPDEAVIRSSAWFWASGQQLDRARQCLTRLDNLPLPAGEKEVLLGDFETDFGRNATALVKFQDAARTAPTNPRTFLAWASLDLRNRDFIAAVKVVTDGLKINPNDGPLKAMSERARTLAGLKLTDAAQPLIESLANDPTIEAGIATLAAIADSQTAHETTEALTDRFAALVEQYPRYLPVLTMLVERDCAGGQFDRAIKTSTRACELMPAEAEPPRLLAMAEASAGNWQAALSASTQWRDRTLDHPQSADMAIARAQIELKHPELATDQLYPYITSAQNIALTNADKPTTANAMLELYLKALCLQDRFDVAHTVVDPLTKQSPQWRRRWLQIVATSAKDSSTGAGEIQRVEADLAANSFDDQLARAGAWCTLGSRFDDNESLQKALSIASALTDAGSIPADAWLLLGDIHQQLDQLPEAEAAFKSALAAAPDSAMAKNNLAMLMWLNHEDLHTAQRLANDAVAATPNSSSMHTTLGEIDEQLNDLDSARTEFESALRLRSDNAEALIGLASVRDKAAHGENTTTLIQQADTILQRSHIKLPKPVELELQRLHATKHAGLPAMEKSASLSQKKL